MTQAIVLLDDLELAEGRRAIAEGTVRLGWDGDWYELDLTSEHARDLWDGIRPYIKAGRHAKAAPKQVPEPKPRAIKAASAADDYPTYRGVVLYHADRNHMRPYWVGFRAWADANGVSYIRHWPSGDGFDYPQDQVKRYEEHLRLAGMMAAKQAS